MHAYSPLTTTVRSCTRSTPFALPSHSPLGVCVDTMGCTCGMGRARGDRDAGCGECRWINIVKVCARRCSAGEAALSPVSTPEKGELGLAGRVWVTCSWVLHRVAAISVFHSRG